MAECLGKITLINVADGAPGTPGVAGSGIQSNMVYYAISKTNSAPPALTEATLKSESGIISFSDVSSTFQIKEGVLYGVQNGTLIPLSINNETDGDILIGLEGGWDTVVPAAPSGWYIWTKTVFTYTDGNQTVTYTVAQNGQDGQDAEAYRIETSQEEILKFIMENGSISITPEILKISIVDKNSNLVENLNADNLSFQIYNHDEGLWTDFYFPLQLTETEKEIEVTLDSPLEISEDGIVKIYDLSTIDSEVILKINYQFEEYSLIKYINVRYGITKDQATLGIHANGITASIQEAGLVFNASGLTVKGGGLKIQNKQGEDTLTFAEESGDLIIKGEIHATSGSFNGEIHATSGSFNGEIHATSGSFESGTIGSFILQDGILKSVDGSISLYGGKIGEGEEIEEAGKIVARNIELGEGAKIQSEIQLGTNVLLSNPDYSIDHSYLKVFKIVDDNEEDEIPGSRVDLVNFTADGKISFGNGESKIVLNGAEGTMQSYNHSSGTGWFISNQESEFNNVTIRGSIRASVLEYGEVQAVGGILLVRSSSKITAAIYVDENNKNLIQLTLEDTKGFAKNDRCLITSDYIGEITKIWGTVKNLELEIDDTQEEESDLNESLDSLTQKKWIQIELDSSLPMERGPDFFVGKPVVSFGYINTSGEGVNNVGIGLNGSTNGALLPPQSLSVFELDSNNKLLPHIILGKLPNNKEIYGSIAGTYGLYAENVLLKGALITKTSGIEPVYCGISTQYAQDAPISSELYDKGLIDFNPSEIVFWAGASGDSKDAIQKAPFFVDRNGNFYSRSGYFKGSIITESTIEAAEIKTAILTGIKEEQTTFNNQENFALTIRDAAQGIVFLKTIDEEAGLTEQIFKLTNDGLGLKTKFQMLDENSDYCFQVDENGRQMSSESFINNDTNTLQLTGTSIGRYKGFDKETKEGALNSSIHFEENSIKFLYDGSLTESQGTKFIIKEEQNEIYNDLFLSSSSSVKYGEKMSYQPVVEGSRTVGYDLYIFD